MNPCPVCGGAELKQGTRPATYPGLMSTYVWCVRCKTFANAVGKTADEAMRVAAIKWKHGDVFKKGEMKHDTVR